MSTGNVLIKEIKERKRAEAYKALLKNAVHVNFAVDDLTERTVERIFAPHQFVFGVDPAPKHAMAAVCQRFAYHQAAKYVENHRPIIEVGPNLSQLARVTKGASGQFHGCCKISARDIIRYREAAASKYVRTINNRKYYEAVQLAASGVQTDYLCNQGFGNCGYEAPFAFSVHSLYDIDPNELADGFENHGTLEMLAFLHMTPAMLKTDRYVDAKNHITFRVVDKRNVIQKFFKRLTPNFASKSYSEDIERFSRMDYNALQDKLRGVSVVMGFPGDESIQYEHDYANLLFYLTRGGFNTRHGFGISIERITNYASQYTLKLSRVELDCVLFHQICFNNLDVIAVPDIHALAAENYDVDFKPVIWTDRKKVETLYTYLISREPKMLTLRVAMAYARANLRSVTLGETVIDQAWDISLGEFERVVTSVYVLARLQFLRSEAVIKSAEFQIKGLYTKKSWMKHIKNLFCCFATEEDPMMGLPIITCKDRTNVFADLSLEYLQELTNEVNINTDREISEVNYPYLLGNVLPEVVSLREANSGVPVKGQLINCGGNGDCFWRVLEELKIDKEPYKSLPSEWVDFTDYIQLCVKLGEHFGVLVRHKVNGRYQDALHTDDANARPNIALVVDDGDRGHYYMIAEADVTITEAHLVAYKLEGGHTGVSFITGSIGLYDHVKMVAHAVWRKNPNTGGITGAYAGFARSVCDANKLGPNDYMRTLTEARRRGLEYCITNNVKGSNVLNIICDNAEQYYDILIKIAPTLGVKDIEAPFVGSGLWNKDNLSHQNLLYALKSRIDALNDVCRRESINYTVVCEVPVVYRAVGGATQERSMKGCASFPKDVENAIAEEHQADIYIRELMNGISEAETNGIKTLKTTLENAHSACVSGQQYLTKVSRDCNIRGVFGVPGAGKTNSLLAEINPNDRVLYLAPTNVLVSAFRSKIKTPSRAETVHKGLWLLQSGRFIADHVVLDECFTQPLPVIAFISNFTRKLTLMGDPAQIAFIDFTGAWGECTTLCSLKDKISYKWLNVSYRIPADVSALPIMKSIYPDLVTRSKNNKPSINYCDSVTDMMNGAHLTFTQSMKSRLSAYHAITVHEAQGNTFPSVILHYGGTQAERTLLRRSPAHVVVALTRHTNNLYIIDPKQEFGVIMTELNNNLELDIITECTGVALPDFTPMEVERFYSCESVNLAQVQVPLAIVESDAVAEVNNLICPISNEVHEYQAVEKNDCEYKGGAKGKIGITEVKDPVSARAKSVKRFPHSQRVFRTDSDRKQKTLHTLLSRYSKKTKNCGQDVLKKEIKCLMAIVRDFIEFRSPTLDEKNQLLAEAMKTFQNRGHTLDDLKDVDCWTDQGASKIEFNMKRQQKVCLSADPLKRDKAGQGIAAWTKTLNFSMCVWCRWLEKLFYASKQIIFASGQDDNDIIRVLDSLCVAKNVTEFFENDWAEFDSSQNNLEHELFCCVMLQLGCPPRLVTLFKAMMYQRYVAANIGALSVLNKKDSGRVDTLIGNTLFNSSVLLSMISNWRELLVVVKGDDSVIAGEKILLDQDRMRDLNGSNGYSFKVKTGKTAEFTNMILTPHGCAVNLPRIAAKVTTRSYKTEKEYEEYKMAVGDLIKNMSCVESQRRAVMLNAMHYGLPECTMQAQADFLSSFSAGEIKYSSLVDFIDTTLHEVN